MEQSMSRNHLFKTIALSAALLVAGVAQAHPKLLSASPAANATVARTAKIELHFSEKLIPKFSGADLTMTGMPGMASHGPMKMKGLATAIGEDGKTLVLTTKTPLPAGDYKLDWHAVAGDSHRINGSYTFKVK
jgi:methionine-rich copper-binding protein CopC